MHFWLTFLAYYCTFFPMHYIGIAGHMRRIYDPYQYQFLKGLQPINQFITVSAFILGSSQVLFFINFFWSAFKGKKSGDNPWESNGLEWTCPSPPPHGNWPGEIPEVYRWPYDYSVPGAPDRPHRPDGSDPPGGKVRNALSAILGGTPRPAAGGGAGGGAIAVPPGGDGSGGGESLIGDPARFGLWLFLGTASMLFIGFTSAFILRRASADWQPLAAPRILWLNTAVLFLSSVTLERSRRRLVGWDLSGAQLWRP